MRPAPPQGPAPQCPTCLQKRPTPKDDGWDEPYPMDWWDCWPCILCGVKVCSVPRSVGRRDTIPCYIKHALDAHPELYLPAVAPRK